MFLLIDVVLNVFFHNLHNPATFISRFIRGCEFTRQAATTAYAGLSNVSHNER